MGERARMRRIASGFGEGGRDAPALVLVPEDVVALGDERLEDVRARGDAHGDAVLVDDGEAVDLVLELHPGSLGDVRASANAARRREGGGGGGSFRVGAMSAAGEGFGK